jgi:hypothetical protein
VQQPIAALALAGAVDDEDPRPASLRPMIADVT